MKRPQWKVITTTMETRKNSDGIALLWGFGFTLHRETTQGIRERQEIRVWIEHLRKDHFEAYRMWRSVQEHQQGRPHTDPTIQMLFETFAREEQVHPRLRELLYLWTRDLDVEEHLQPLLLHNLCELRKRGFRQYIGARPFFA